MINRLLKKTACELLHTVSVCLNSLGAGKMLQGLRRDRTPKYCIEGERVFCLYQ